MTSSIDQDPTLYFPRPAAATSENAGQPPLYMKADNKWGMSVMPEALYHHAGGVLLGAPSPPGTDASDATIARYPYSYSFPVNKTTFKTYELRKLWLPPNIVWYGQPDDLDDNNGGNPYILYGSGDRHGSGEFWSFVGKTNSFRVSWTKPWQQYLFEGLHGYHPGALMGIFHAGNRDLIKQHIAAYFNSPQNWLRSHARGLAIKNPDLFSMTPASLMPIESVMFGKENYALCRDNPGLCDAVKIRFCQAEADKAMADPDYVMNPLCSCYNVTLTKEYKDYVALLKRKGLTEIAPPRCLFGNCRGVDLQQQLIPSTIANDLKGDNYCPQNVSQLLQELTVTGDNNVLTDVKMDGNITSTTTVQAPVVSAPTTGGNPQPTAESSTATPASTTKDDEIWANPYYIKILGFILAIIVAIVFAIIAKIKEYTEAKKNAQLGERAPDLEGQGPPQQTQ